MINIRKFVRVALSLLLLMGTLSLFSQVQENKVEDVTALEAFALIKENLDNSDFFIIDVRTPAEYKDGHLKGAVNINLISETFKEDVAKLDSSKIYLIYCRSGYRSSLAVSIMQKLEFACIYHMANGIIEWNKEGLPVEKNGASLFSKTRKTTKKGTPLQ